VRDLRRNDFSSLVQQDLWVIERPASPSTDRSAVRDTRRSCRRPAAPFETSEGSRRAKVIIGMVVLHANDAHTSLTCRAVDLLYRISSLNRWLPVIKKHRQRILGRG
jgi:hypothetical protein